MTQQLEIEYKNMLTAEEFSALCTAFRIKASAFIKQVNCYFDTPTFALKAKKTVLRIRETGNQHDFTLKQPHNGMILETHQLLDAAESRAMIQMGIVPSGEIEQVITQLGVDADKLVFIGELITKRCQFPYQSGTLFLDHSIYLDHDDYELEYEAADPYSGDAIFSALLREHCIPRRPSKSKMIRLFQAIQEKRG
ncbi:CYTH domain-containing protein [Sporolactobacillus sp. CPB3-1]|uniref:CYTH domain-containing protein n=1 Tax=Sporolactobacillus mangiferae TaxID=2940498 RepID=A0ABT0M826_9BACL|nr:CYTH domain-containing protein [Sporolactobacillus mangiferae]MCL1631027.1 CYTH domain-containing protein [Sporolactobacillus mangiferae]